MYVDESSPPPGSPEVEPRVDAPIAEEPTDGDAPVEEDAGATEDGADVTEGTEEGGEEDQTEAEGGEGAGEDAPAPEPAEPDAEAPEPDDAKADDAGEEPAEPAGEGETPPEEGAPPETPETPEPAIQTPEFVLQPRRVALRMCEKSLPADATDAECVYFLKDSAEQAVDTPEALAMHVQHGSPVRGTEFADAGPDARAGVPPPPLRRRRVRRGHRDGRGLVRADVEGAGERDR